MVGSRYLDRKSLALKNPRHFAWSGPWGQGHLWDIMPQCVTSMVKTWLPNPKGRDYMGHRWTYTYCYKYCYKCWIILDKTRMMLPYDFHLKYYYTPRNEVSGGYIGFTLSVCLSVCPLTFRVRPVASTVQDGFFPYLVQMITSRRGCVACDDPWPFSSRSFGLDSENRVRSVASSSGWILFIFGTNNHYH